MLKLEKICKSYKVGDKKQVVLDNITLDFKKRELVFILGASGSGKSTLLNIIAGNLRADSGEIWLDNLCVNEIEDEVFNNYRTSMIGQIFQDYNLIDYMNVWDNIMLCYNDGLNNQEIDLLLKQLEIYDKKKVKVSKLSGGEKQRVAIARALVNNPDIILADEPTGALDSQNGIQVMEILKKIANNKLVIVVSHDVYLANKYASRIINIKDGKCQYIPLIMEQEQINDIKKSKIKFISIIKMALKNLSLKKRRTFLTSLAISLGIISMFSVINLYQNFSREISNLEKEIVSIFPIIVENGDYEINDNNIRKSDEKIIIKNKNQIVHTNKINQDYLNYINNIHEVGYVVYDYDISMPVISDRYNFVDKKYLSVIPSSEYILENYDIVYGRNITNKFDVLLKIDDNNNVASELLNYFAIYSDIDYDLLIGRKLRVVLNDDYYIQDGKYYIIQDNVIDLYEDSYVELTIVGIIKEKNVTNNDSFIYYDKGIIDMVINNNKNSKIVNSQIESNYNVLALNMNKEKMLSYLGYNSLPTKINIYVGDIDKKEIVIKKLDEYNEINDKLIYSDTMASSIKIVREFISIISIILILFSVVAIIISSLMVGILTNVRVVERKREIGIFRSLGASKRDVRRLFNLENIFIGLMASIIGFIVICILVNPVNHLIDMYIGIDNIFNINYKVLLLVLLINIFIVKISGSIPSLHASKMDIVDLLYNR